jgi:hypothetical protein
MPVFTQPVNDDVDFDVARLLALSACPIRLPYPLALVASFGLRALALHHHAASLLPPATTGLAQSERNPDAINTPAEEIRRRRLP